MNNPAPFGLVRFSPDQKLLAAGVEGRVHVVDAFSGEPRFSLPTGVPPGGSAPEFAFTPDSRYLLSGARPRCGTWHLVVRLSPGSGADLPRWRARGILLHSRGTALPAAAQAALTESLSQLHHRGPPRRPPALLRSSAGPGAGRAGQSMAGRGGGAGDNMHSW